MRRCRSLSFFLMTARRRICGSLLSEEGQEWGREKEEGSDDGDVDNNADSKKSTLNLFQAFLPFFSLRESFTMLDSGQPPSRRRKEGEEQDQQDQQLRRRQQRQRWGSTTTMTNILALIWVASAVLALAQAGNLCCK